MDLALNNLQRLICHKTHQTNQPTNQWAPTHGLTIVGRSAKTCFHQLYADTGCRLDDFPSTMTDKDCWRERKRERESNEFVLSTSLDDDDDDDDEEEEEEEDKHKKPLRFIS